MTRLSSPEALEAFRQEITSRQDPTAPSVAVCAGTGCLACGAKEVIDAFRTSIQEQGLDAQVTIKDTESKPRLLWLELEFAKPLPRLEQWP